MTRCLAYLFAAWCVATAFSIGLAVALLALRVFLDILGAKTP